MPLDKSTITVGMRVQDSTGNVGTVAWVGRIEKKDRPPNNDPATYTAVEFDYPSELHRTDGVLLESGKRYCQCPPHTVEFLKPRYLEAERNDAAVEYLRSHFEEEAIGHLTDALLIKFCVARKYEMSAVIEMLEGHLEWAGKATPSPVENFPENQPHYWPFVLSPGLARDGSIVTFERPCNNGTVSTGGILTEYGNAKVVRMHITCLEMAKAQIAEANRCEVLQRQQSGLPIKSPRIRSVTAIFDISNLAVTDKTAVLDFAKTVGRIGQDNYPEHLGRAFIVNAPGIFTGIWRIVKFFLDERTKSKVHVLGPGEHLEVLERYMDRSMIPDFLGGDYKEWAEHGGRIGSEDATKQCRGTPQPFSFEHVTDEEMALAAISRTPPLESLASEVGVSDGSNQYEPEAYDQRGSMRSARRGLDRRSSQSVASVASPSREATVGPAPPQTRVVAQPFCPSLESPRPAMSSSQPQTPPGFGQPQLLTRDVADLLAQAMQVSSKTQGQEGAKAVARSIESLGRAHEHGARAVSSGLRAVATAIVVLALALFVSAWMGRPAL